MLDSFASTTRIFYETTGFDILGVASSTGSGAIKLFVGNSLAVIYQLRGWLAAGAVIGFIVLFASRALRVW